MKNKLIALLTMGALAVGTLAGCGNTAAADTAASAADTAAETPAEAVSTAADEVADTNADSADKYADLSGSVSMSGSTSMEKLANAVAESFMEKYPNVTVTAEFTGSSAGIESVLAGSVDIGNSSRNLKDDEKSAGAAENIVAIDGIAVVADPANKVEDLTKDQLVSIYTGETKNWSEVGGDDEVIKQCLYFGLLFGDFAFGCHYEGSGQCVVAGLNIFFRCVYAIELQSLYGIIYNIEGNITDRTGSGSNLCHNCTGGIQLIRIFAGIFQTQKLLKCASCTGSIFSGYNGDCFAVVKC